AFSFRDDQQARSIAIETMNKTGPHLRSLARKVLEMICECVGECAGRRACRRVDDESGRFVHDKESIVFVNNLDRNIFRYESVRSGRDQFDFNLVVLTKFVRRFCRLAVNEYVFILDQTLQTRSTPALDL